MRTFTLEERAERGTVEEKEDAERGRSRSRSRSRR